ncbi:MAG: hypothetical protein M4579_000125 [Chaenotheca gracillima]|nr:MAG: hypothetical protein M4579_000125 [Chaenotheca gracillima]
MTATLLSLPSELLDQILSVLPAEDLAALSQTCKRVYVHTQDEHIWKCLLQDHVPGCVLDAPPQGQSFRKLYQAFHPHWFLTKHKIWFSDEANTGNILIARFSPRRQTIEAYRLVAERRFGTWFNWENELGVAIHEFDPYVRLHLDDPVVRLKQPLEYQTHNTLSSTPSDRYHGEVRMEAQGPHSTRHGTFFLARKMLPERQTPQMALWPPHTIRMSERVRNESQEQFRGDGNKPVRSSEASLHHFRLRRWLEWGRVNLGMSTNTFSTLLPELYTPTRQKPWRGIWIGDYAPHGCEFLLMYQPDDESIPGSEPSGDGQTEDETPYHGFIEAIKLTGDPNVPRGECTFIAEDIGNGGLIRNVEDGAFKGAKIVKSKGHIASSGFIDDTWMETQLIIISNDKLAHYWSEFDHISFYHRVDIDQFLTPEED